MKKMLILVLVLGMASLANAGLYTASSTTPFVITITSADASDNAAAIIEWTNYVAAGGNTADATITSGAADIANLFVYTVGGEGADVYYAALATMSAGWSNGVVLATIDLNGAADNVGTTPCVMNLIDGDTLNVIGSVSVMIPEPITMSLLAVGGLFLRRRK